jgi:hypothetical protein
MVADRLVNKVTSYGHRTPAAALKQEPAGSASGSAVKMIGRSDCDCKHVSTSTDDTPSFS